MEIKYDDDWLIVRTVHTMYNTAAVKQYLVGFNITR